MEAGLGVLFGVLASLWKLLVFLLVVLVVLGALLRVLEGAVGSSLGAAGPVAQALPGLLGLVCLAILGLVLVPEAARAFRGALAVPGCAAEGGDLFPSLFQAAAGLVLALAGLRMLAGVVEAAAGAALGGPAPVAAAVRALLEGVGGLLLLVAVGPLVGVFLCR